MDNYKEKQLLALNAKLGMERKHLKMMTEYDMEASGYISDETKEAKLDLMLLQLERKNFGKPQTKY